MDEWVQILFIFIGVVAGGFFGVEYGNWRLGRKVKKYETMLFNILGIDYATFSKATSEGQRQLFKTFVKARLVPMLKRSYQEFFPDLKMPKPPPSSIKTLNGKNFFVPHCPQCGFAAAPIYDLHPGVWVQASCPTHGVYKQKAPETLPIHRENEMET